MSEGNLKKHNHSQAVFNRTTSTSAANWNNIPTLVPYSPN